MPAMAWTEEAKLVSISSASPCWRGALSAVEAGTQAESPMLRDKSSASKYTGAASLEIDAINRPATTSETADSSGSASFKA